jgi:hypothetical protein
MFGYEWKEGDFKLYALSAGVAGSTVAVVTNPLVVVRTRMQSEIFYNTNDFHFQKKYGNGPMGVINVMRNIYS